MFPHIIFPLHFRLYLSSNLIILAHIYTGEAVTQIICILEGQELDVTVLLN